MRSLATIESESESGFADSRLERLREITKDQSLSQGEEFELASGNVSRFYFNMKATTFDPEGSSLIADLILDRLPEDEFDWIGGLEIGSSPITACVSMRSHQLGRPLQGFLVRKRAKEHGTKQRIEPRPQLGARVVVVEDVTTTGGSAMQAVEALRAIGCEVRKIITVVDRLEGAEENLRCEGIELVALLTALDFGIEG